MVKGDNALYTTRGYVCGVLACVCVCVLVCGKREVQGEVAKIREKREDTNYTPFPFRGLKPFTLTLPPPL